MAAKKSPKSTQDPLVGQRLVLEELRRSYDKVMSSVDILDTKLQSILGLSTIVVSLIGFLDLDKIQALAGNYFNYWIGTIVLLYLVLFFVVFTAIKPREYPAPISNDWKELDLRYFYESENVVLDKINSDYLEFGERASIIAKSKADSLRWSIALFFVIVLIIVGSLSISQAGLSTNCISLKVGL